MIEDESLQNKASLDDGLEDDQVEISAEASASSASSASASASASSTSEGLGELQARIEQLEGELITAKDQVLRAQADVQNARRRAEQDVEKAHKFGLEKFVNDILPVADNLERAVDSAASAEGDLGSVLEGVELTLKSLADALSRHKVESVFPEGEPFDPQLHQAMTMVEQPDAEPNTVINVFQRGYTLHGRLVRPAMVVVSK